MSEAVTELWVVRCEKALGSKKPGNRKETVWVRADTRKKAELIGKAATGLRYASASVYRPWLDPKFSGNGWCCVPARD